MYIGLYFLRTERNQFPKADGFINKQILLGQFYLGERLEKKKTVK